MLGVSCFLGFKVMSFISGVGLFYLSLLLVCGCILYTSGVLCTPLIYLHCLPIKIKIKNKKNILFFYKRRKICIKE